MDLSIEELQKEMEKKFEEVWREIYLIKKRLLQEEELTDEELKRLRERLREILEEGKEVPWEEVKEKI